MYGQRRSADGQQHGPLHQSGHTHGGHRERRRRSGSTASAQAASGTADRPLDTADHTIDRCTADGPSRSDGRVDCSTSDTQCVPENIHLGSFASA
jgi:hypothetical protein